MYFFWLLCIVGNPRPVSHTLTTVSRGLPTMIVCWTVHCFRFNRWHTMCFAIWSRWNTTMYIIWRKIQYNNITKYHNNFNREFINVTKYCNNWEFIDFTEYHFSVSRRFHAKQWQNYAFDVISKYREWDNYLYNAKRIHWYYSKKTKWYVFSLKK